MVKITKPSVNKSAYFSKQAKTTAVQKTPAQKNVSASAKRLIAAFGHGLIEPFTIAILGCILGIGAAVIAQLQFDLPQLECAYWGAGIAACGLVLAFLVHSRRRFEQLNASLNDTRRQIAITARILSETLEESERLKKQQPLPSFTVSTQQSATSQQGLANIARAQVILANKSDADISVLSGLIRDLADIVSEQERELDLARVDAKEARSMAQDAAKIAKQILHLPRSSLNAPPSKLTEQVILGDTQRSNHDTLLVSKLDSAFEDDGFAVSLQPIVTLPQRKVKLYELGLMLKGEVAGRSGSLIRKAVLAAGFAANYDKILIERSLTMIKHFRSRQKDITILCELTGALLIANGEFDAITQNLRQQPVLAQSLVLGLSADTYLGLSVSERDLLSFLGETGVKFALMGLTNMRLDPQALSNDGVRFVTIDVVRLMEAVPTGLSGLDVHVADLAGLFARRKIELVVQNIASDRDLLDIIDMDIPLAQGKLLGEPRALAETIPLSETVSAPQAIVSEIRPQAIMNSQSIARQPLKNFLRRA